MVSTGRTRLFSGGWAGAGNARRCTMFVGTAVRRSTRRASGSGDPTFFEGKFPLRSRKWFVWLQRARLRSGPDRGVAAPACGPLDLRASSKVYTDDKKALLLCRLAHRAGGGKGDKDDDEAEPVDLSQLGWRGRQLPADDGAGTPGGRGGDGRQRGSRRHRGQYSGDGRRHDHPLRHTAAFSAPWPRPSLPSASPC